MFPLRGGRDYKVRQLDLVKLSQSSFNSDKSNLLKRVGFKKKKKKQIHRQQQTIISGKTENHKSGQTIPKTFTSLGEILRAAVPESISFRGEANAHKEQISLRMALQFRCISLLLPWPKWQ